MTTDYRTFPCNAQRAEQAVTGLSPGQQALWHRLRCRLWLRECLPMPVSEVLALGAELGLDHGAVLAVLTPARDFGLSHRVDLGYAVVSCQHLTSTLGRLRARQGGVA